VCCSVLQCVAVCCSISYIWPYMYTSQERMLATAASYFTRRCDPTYIKPSIVSVVQSVAVYCSVLQCVAVCCSVSPSVKVRCSVLQSVAVRRCNPAYNMPSSVSVLQRVATCCGVLQCIAVCCGMLQRVVNFAVCRCDPTYEKP